jgi:ABC-type uncharacterized transport system substrate-binding protein
MPRRRYLAGMLLLASATPAAAHPHVWVDYRATMQLDHGVIVALAEQWSFDEDFSGMALGDLPEGAMTPTLTARDIGILRDKDFSNLKNYGYFTHVWSAGRPVPIKAAEGFDARLSGGKLVYSFVLTLAAPVDPRQSRVDIGIWDDSFYVDLEPQRGAQALAVSGPGATGCRAAAIADKTHSIYSGMVTPLTIHVRCAGDN